MRNLFILGLFLMSSSVLACDSLLGNYRCDLEQASMGDDDGGSTTSISKDERGYSIEEKIRIFGEERSVNYSVQCVEGRLQVDAGTRGMKQVLTVYENQGIIKRRMDTYESREPDAEIFFSTEADCKKI